MNTVSASLEAGTLSVMSPPVETASVTGMRPALTVCRIAGFAVVMRAVQKSREKTASAALQIVGVVETVAMRSAPQNLAKIAIAAQPTAEAVMMSVAPPKWFNVALLFRPICPMKPPPIQSSPIIAKPSKA